MVPDAIDPDAKKMMRVAGNTGAIGIEIALAIFTGYFGGQWLDGRFHSTPWMKWIGFAAGAGAAIKALVRVTRQYRKALENEERRTSSSARNVGSVGNVGDRPGPDQGQDKDPPQSS